MSTTVSFPGLGIGEFSVDRVAFEFFGKPIYWYGVIIMLGIVAAFVHALIRSKQEGVKADDILDVGIFTVLFGVLGARLYYVVTTLDTHHYDSFTDVIAVWEGGLAIYGGIIAGCTAIVVTCLYKKINPLKVTDAVAPGVGLAQAIGRWGNFMNGEAFGYEVAEDSLLYPFRMGLVSDYTHTGSEMHFYHPTFLYESLWNVLGFVIITLLYRKKKFNGQITLMYFAWYGFGRMFIEGLRTDSLYVGPFRISQVIGALCFIAGAALLVTGFLLSGKGKLDKWLTVRWAEAVPAEGKAVADANDRVAASETAVDTDGQVAENEDTADPSSK
jgi:phosphatidylglycerol:prolipoprotein diacylglycerol transferase